MLAPEIQKWEATKIKKKSQQPRHKTRYKCCKSISFWKEKTKLVWNDLDVHNSNNNNKVTNNQTKINIYWREEQQKKQKKIYRLRVFWSWYWWLMRLLYRNNECFSFVLGLWFNTLQFVNMKYFEYEKDRSE